MANVIVVSETPQRVIIRDEAATRTVKVVAQGPQGPVGSVNPQMFTLRDQAQASADSADIDASAAQSSSASAFASANAAADSAASALASQQATATSATQASTSATLAQDWAIKTVDPVSGAEYSSKYHAQAASASAGSASSSATAAAASATTASTKAGEASDSATAAQTSATNSQNSATASANSATAAGSSETAASASQSAAATSATNAANSATAAADSATAASSSATSASGSASTATTKASEAATSATNAAASATTASTKASEASTSATNAAASASAAATSATNTANALVGERSAVATLTNKTITNPVIDSGTANGVAYLNGSKVLTSGGGLTFDGTSLALNAGSGNIQVGVSGDTSYHYGRIVDNGGQAFYFGIDNSAGSFFGAGAYGRSIYSEGDHPVQFVVNSAERMRLTSTGLGIGTSSPLAPLHVHRSGGSSIRIDTDAAASSTQLNFATAGVNKWSLYRPGSGADLRLFDNVNTVDVMTWQAGGNVGIGTSSPTAKLELSNGANSNGVLKISATNTSTANFASMNFATPARIWSLGTETGSGRFFLYNGTAGYDQLGFGGGPNSDAILTALGDGSLVFATGATTRMLIDSAGNVGIGVVPMAWSAGYKTIQIGSVGSVSGTNSATYIGQNWYQDAAGQNRYITAGIAASFGSDATGAHAWYKAPSGTAGQPVSFTQAMTLTPAGNLLVASTLDDRGHRIKVKGPSSGGIAAAGADYCVAIYGPDGNAYLGLNINTISTVTANPLIFGTNNTERARIDSSGNLMVGKTTSGYTLDGVEVSGAGVVTITRSSGTCIGLNRKSDGGVIDFYRSGSAVGGVSITTTATSYNTSSDYRLKNITGPITTSGAYIDSLNPVEGSWKADGSTFVGLIAHEVQEASRTQVATGVKDGEEMQAMDYSASELIANMIAELKSLRARVAALENN